MKKFKFIILGLLISTSANAQQPSLPELDLPDFSAEGDAPKNTENQAAAVPAVTVSDEKIPSIPALPTTLAPAVATKEQTKVLNKAITEVFSEEKASGAAVPVVAEPKIPELPVETGINVLEPTPTAQPVIDNKPIAAPAVPVAAEPEVTADNPEIPAIMQPEETVAPEAPKVEKPAEVKKPSKPKVKKAKPAPKIVFPAQTPKSLRQDYLSPNSNVQPAAITPQGAPLYAPKSYNPQPAPQMENMQYQDMPEGTKPIMLNDVWKKENAARIADAALSGAQSEESVKVEPLEQQVVEKQVVKVAAMPKPQPDNPKKESLDYAAAEQILYTKSEVSETKKKSKPKSELDIITKLPEKEKKLNIKPEIKVVQGNFDDPFQQVPADVLAESEITPLDQQQSGMDAPVVDFTDNQMENTEGLPNPTAANNIERQPLPDFYDQEVGMKMDVRTPMQKENSTETMKNAFEAFQVGQYESAIEYYKEVLLKNPKNGKARFGLATSYHKSKQYEDAKAEYLRIINDNPEFWPAVNNYIMLVTEENPVKSIEKLEDLSLKNPKFAAIPAQLGNLYYTKGDSKKSIEKYVEAIKLDPKNIDYKYNLAVVLEKSGHARDAAQVYGSLLEDAAKGIKLPENPVSIKERFDVLTSKARS